MEMGRAQDALCLEPLVYIFFIAFNFFKKNYLFFFTDWASKQVWQGQNETNGIG